MRRTPVLLAAVALLLGCGGDDEREPAAATSTATPSPTAAVALPDPGGFDYCATQGLSAYGAAKVVLFTSRQGLPELFRAAGSRARLAYTQYVDPKSAPVELYFFPSPEDAAAALPAARDEVASLGVGGRDSSLGQAANVIYFAPDRVARKAVTILNGCLEEAGGRPMRIRSLSAAAGT